MRIACLLLSLCLCANAAWATASDAEQGLPPLHSYTEVDHGGSGQVWRVHQLPNRVLAFACAPGLLFFDGGRFEQVEVPGGAVYDFSVGPRQRIYLGTGQVLGYLEPDAQRHWRHVTLKPPANAPPAGDIGRVVLAFDRVFFLSRRVLLSYHEQHGWNWRSTKTGYSELRLRGDRLLLFESGVGWLQFDHQTQEFVAAKEPGFPTAGPALTSEEPGEPWYASDRNKIFRFDARGWTALPLSDAATLVDDRIEALARLPNGDIAVGTRFGGLYQFASDGQLRRRIAAELLPGERITDIEVDAEGGLWLSIDGGIVRVEADNRVTTFGREAGATQIESIARIGGELYLATRVGLKRLQPPVRPGMPARFASDRIERKSTWSLLATAHGTLVATGSGIALLPADVRQPAIDVLNDNVRVSALVAATDGWIYAVQTAGIRRLRWNGAAFEVDPQVLQLVPMFDATWHDDALWTSIDGGGVYRIAAMGNWPTPQVSRFGSDEGIADGRSTFGTDAEGLIVFVEGRAHRQAVARFDVDPRFPSDIAIDRLVQIDASRFWAGKHPQRLRLLQRGVDGRYQVLSEPLGRFAIPSRNLLRDADGTLWLGDDRGLMRMTAPAISAPLSASPLIRQVRSAAGEILSGGAGTEFSALLLDLPATVRDLQLRLALPSYQQAVATTWRHRTDDGAWLPFDGELRRTFAAGVTQIDFQALDGEGRASAITRLQLHIAPLWHETAFARGLAALALLLLLVSSAASYGRWRTRKLERERARLEHLVAERTADVRRQADEIRLLSEARTRFFANVSHEFRTPLTLVLGPLGDALEGRFGALPGALQAALETARSSARRLLRLVGELLDLSRLAAGRFDLRVAEHDLAEQLRREIDTFARQARSRDIDLAGEGLADPLLLWYDADQLERMVSNLLSNALKFTPNGGRVRLRVVPTLEQVGIEVEDNGPGIAAEDHARVFERFYQGSTAAALDAPGTGIGLALVRELIDLHHGHAELLSEPGQGSCFVLWLRRGKAHFQPDQMADAHPGPIALTADQLAGDSTAIPAQAEAGDVLRPIVLVVDDHAQLRRYLSDRLGDAYQVLSARNGEEALASIHESLPDVVVSDVMMPGIDGMGLAREMRRNPETAGVPLLLLSARAHKRDIVDGLEAGADDYLTKPFDTSELIARIEALLESRRRLRAQIENELGGAPRVSGDNADADAPTPIESAHQRFGERLQQTLERQLGDPQFGVAELAAALHVDRATLFRRTKASYQCTPSELLRERRLQRAQALLSARRGSVSEVAYAAGFDNLSHFSQAFRKRFGVAPSSLL